MCYATYSVVVVYVTVYRSQFVKQFVCFIVDCDCNVTGTVNDSKECLTLGGQCLCASEIITRTCSACDYTYFGFDGDGCEGRKDVRLKNQLYYVVMRYCVLSNSLNYL